MNLQGDFENFISGSWSKSATINGSPVKLIFNDWSSDSDLGDVQSEVNVGRKNFITSKSQISQIVEGDSVVVDGITYTVYKVEDYNSYEFLVWVSENA